MKSFSSLPLTIRATALLGLLLPRGYASLQSPPQPAQPPLFAVLADIQYGDKEAGGARHFRMALRNGVHHVTLKGMVEAPEENAYAFSELHSDHLRGMGVGAECSRPNMKFPMNQTGVLSPK